MRHLSLTKKNNTFINYGDKHGGYVPLSLTDDYGRVCVVNKEDFNIENKRKNFYQMRDSHSTGSIIRIDPGVSRNVCWVSSPYYV